MTQQQPDSLFEVKCPIYCEYIYHQKLATSDDDAVVADDDKSFYKYLNDPPDHSSSSSSISDKYYVPGFPGIEYFFLLCVQGNMDFYFTVFPKYEIYMFDVDITCTINNNEPQDFHYSMDSQKGDKKSDLVLLKCSDECEGCAACKDKILFIRVEGNITVKNVDHLPFSFDISWEDRKLYNENGTKDFVLVIEGKEFWVHKSILIKNSVVFARMLESEKWKETTENKIVIPEFSFKIVALAIQTCYYGKKYFHSLERDNFLMLFQFADKYDMEKLKNAIKEILVLTPSTVVEYANFFLQNNADELVESCIDYILVCTQNSLPIKDIEMLDAQIHSMFFTRALISPILKKNLKPEHRTIFEDDD